MSTRKGSREELGSPHDHFEGSPENPREWLETSIGIFGGTPERVRLRLDNPAARVTCERYLHSSHRILAVGEGASGLTMEVAGNDELERWILD